MPMPMPGPGPGPMPGPEPGPGLEASLRAPLPQALSREVVQFRQRWTTVPVTTQSGGTSRWS